jgi:para-aminobenzoate synthetase/4-amino-4-deoxychorismate lyase
MGIISDVEPSPRGIYCGAIGMIPPGDGLDGAMFNVAIRTAIVDPHEGIATYGVGGGVTWDSQVDAEYAEALAKAAALRPGSRIDGLFETLRWDGDWVLLDEHLDRLSWAAAVHELAFDRYDAVRLLEELTDDIDGPARIRLTIDRRGDMRAESEPAPDRFSTAPGPAAGVRTVAIDLDPVDPADPRLYVKTTDRRIYEARRRRHPGVDDVLLTNTNGDITESTIANVAVLLDGTWVTPPVSDGLLPGVLRARLVADGVLTERSVSVAEASRADGLALVNSVRGWQAAALAPVAAPRAGQG